MDRAKLEALETLLAKATPGPWQAKDPYLWDEIIGDIDGPDDGQYHCTDVAQAYGRADAALIVAAVNALPALLRLARAVADAPRGEAVEVGDDGGELRQPRVLIHTTREELRKGRPLAFQDVILLLADAADTTAGEDGNG